MCLFVYHIPNVAMKMKIDQVKINGKDTERVCHSNNTEHKHASWILYDVINYLRVWNWIKHHIQITIGKIWPLC